MIGRFITTTIQCQNQCRNSNDYDFPERLHISDLLKRRPVMSIEVGNLSYSYFIFYLAFTLQMQKSRLKSQDDYEDPQPIIPTGPPVNMTGVRRIFFG
jgi:hypothetical protein